MRYTEVEVARIKSLYEDGLNTVQISKLMHKSQSGVERLLKRCGYTKFGNQKSLSDEEIKMIFDEYKNGKTCQQIYIEHFAERYRSSAMVERVIREAGLSRGKYIKPVILNHDYFEEIDSERKAYWLGLLFADGCVRYLSEKSKTIRLELIQDDWYLVRNFLEDIGSDKQTLCYAHQSKPHAVGIVYSCKMADDLARLGITPNKTVTAHQLPIITDTLMPHFIRGFFDGDGCVSIHIPSDQKINRASVSICANEAIALQLRDILDDSAGINASIVDMRKYGNDILNVRFCKNADIEKFYNYIYKDATIYMRRKRLKFETFLKERSRPILPETLAS